MKLNCTKVLILLVFCLNVSVLFSQSYWKRVETNSVRKARKEQRRVEPNVFKVFELDLEKFKSVLRKAPSREEDSKKSNAIVQFPNANGELQSFQVLESSIMDPVLANKYPMIKTYKAFGINDPTASMRFSVTQFGIHAMMLSGKQGAVYIDPYTSDLKSYMVYEKEALEGASQDFSCLQDEGVLLESIEVDKSSQRFAANDQKLRTYRLALSCTGEYAALFAGSGSVTVRKANVLSQMVITMNRVNEIYERDLAITMQFVANNDDVIYLDSATDPWMGEYNTKTAETLDDVIGVANYDIGHNFNTSGGGHAGCIGCVCVSTSKYSNHKGMAYTGSSNPVGDAFYIDYVAHEMGHQFGAYHIQSSIECFSGNGESEVEPGSGSSIMGYAGICDPNVQYHSDAHFNYISVKQILNYVKNGLGNECAQESVLVNQAPIANAGGDYTIPASTAFVLTGSATDVDGVETLTYSWYQNDAAPSGKVGKPQSTWDTGPLYRSLLPSDSPKRYLPKIEDVLNGNLTPTWEVTPSVTRDLNFAFLVRDNGSGIGNGIGQTDADLMKVTVNAAAGPFTVTSQNEEGIFWSHGDTEIITWNVAGTTANNINTSRVNILLSTNGGETFDVVLAENTPNDGAQEIVVPDTPALSCRIMVQPVGNIYYAVNSHPFALDYEIVCVQYDSGNLGLAIQDAVTNGQQGVVLSSSLNISDSETIESTVVYTDITHTWVGDLFVELKHPNGEVKATLYNRNCNNGQDDLDVVFNDEGGAITCANPVSGTFSPQTPLNEFSGLGSNGEWKLEISDFSPMDYGTLNSWYIEICTATPTSLGVDKFAANKFTIFPNPNKGEFTIKLNSLSGNDIKVDVYDVRGRLIYKKSFTNSSDFIQTIGLNNVQSGMYLVTVNDGERSATKKIIVE
ncbi:reprolysin-like metallopeptidase [Mangrovimonas xylaniphaga]|uniref:reprolysin-like metallopeptidase n=1 Tax=Mangrovimonas xylaniphaga TaxID=1645915 RepID=UPI0006B5F1BE|nr:zinc-dependent metalloprotease family protein [Mangrovimonas xylaniphaga]